MSNADRGPAVLDFGKHQGCEITRVPAAYLRWMVNSKHLQSTLAAAELARRGTTLPVMEVTGHAVDRASQLFLGKWRKDRTSGEGMHTWLHRMAEHALTHNQRDTQGRYVFQDMVFIFADLEEHRWPVLKTVLRNPKALAS